MALGKKCEIVCVEKFSSVNNVFSSWSPDIPKVPVREKSAQVRFAEHICVMCDVPGTMPGRAKDAERRKDGMSLLEEVPDNSTST